MMQKGLKNEFKRNAKGMIDVIESWKLKQEKIEAVIRQKKDKSSVGINLA